MGKLLNSVAKGLKIASHVAVGCLIYGGVTAASNFHPNPTTIPGLIWYSVGISLSTALFSGGMRWAQYDPSKVGK